MSELLQKIKELPFFLEPNVPVERAEMLVRLGQVLAVVGEWQKQLQKHIDKFGGNTKTFSEMVEENSMACKGFPNCIGCTELCAIEKWIRLNYVKEELRRHLK